MEIQFAPQFLDFNGKRENPAAMSGDPEGFLRLDKWLWQARFFKTRTLAGRFCQSTRIRINAHPAKPHAKLKPGDVLTFTQGSRVRVIEVRGLGIRRGPAAEAQTLYDDLSLPIEATDRKRKKETSRGPGLRDAGQGRPTKADRRAIDKLRWER